MWQMFEDNFRLLYAASDHPGKPVQLILGLLYRNLLKNLSDEQVTKAWGQTLFFQALCCQWWLTWKLPCDPSELTYFHRRIGEDGAPDIFEVSAARHSDKAKEAEGVVDSTVQKKNITYPKDSKLLTKIVTGHHTMTKLEDVKLWQSYQREIKSILRISRFKSNTRRQGKSQGTVRRLRTIAGILVHQLKRKLTPKALNIYQQDLNLYDRVRCPHRADSGKIYSIHARDASCISKGKAHNKCEFGAKAYATVASASGIIVVALAYQGNSFDRNTLPAVLSQFESIVEQRPSMAICNRGYRDKRKVRSASIEISESDKRTQTTSDNRHAKERFRRHAAIETFIGRLKNDHRTLRNYLKGQTGKAVNPFTVCVASNFRKITRILCFCNSESLSTHFDPMLSRYRPAPDVTF